MLQYTYVFKMAAAMSDVKRKYIYTIWKPIVHVYGGSIQHHFYTVTICIGGMHVALIG